MPVIFDKDQMFTWLEDRPQNALIEMMKPYPAEKMNAYMVGKAVNSPFNDVEECIKEKKTNSSLF
jgi:putative SOS response-associated peptidase YedK